MELLEKLKVQVLDAQEIKKINGGVIPIPPPIYITKKIIEWIFKKK